MRIDLVVVSYRSERWLPRCLESIYDGSYEGVCWLVDNDALAAECHDELVRRFPSVRYLRPGANLGFGGGNNLGIACALQSGADLVGLINPDAWMEPGWHPRLVDALRLAPGLGLVSPLQLRYEDDAPACWTRGALGIESLDDPRLDEPFIRARWLEASAVFIRREVLDVIGGFDPLFSLYFEDNDLCRRARLAGFELGVVPAVRYHHFGGGSLDGRAGTERGIRCDLGQALYTLTDPENSFARNVARTTRLLARRMRGSLLARSDSGAAFWPLVGRLLPLVWSRKAAIYGKWKSGREGVLTAQARPSVPRP